MGRYRSDSIFVYTKLYARYPIGMYRTGRIHTYDTTFTPMPTMMECDSDGEEAIAEVDANLTVRNYR
jgi:hypothetical protein